MTMKLGQILIVIISMWASLAIAQPELKNGHPQRYVVVEGDTLWGISSKFLNEPWLWPEIWQANRQILNPHLIYPGDTLNLVYIEGRPQLVIQRGEGSNTTKLSPGARITSNSRAIPAIPLEKIAVFMRESRIVEPESLEDAPYVLAGGKGHILLGAGDQLYARGVFEEGQNSFGIYREGTIYKNPETKEILGMHAEAVGRTRLVALDGEVATMNVLSTTGDARMGDRLLPLQERRLTAVYQPTGPENKELSGQIIDVASGVSQIGKLDIVMINLGSREGIKEGNVMGVNKLGETVRDPVQGGKIKLPDERAGLLMFFRVYEKMSYGLVLDSSRPLSLGDTVTAP